MRERSDQSKLKSRRGQISDLEYAGWKKANESKSFGTASMIYDPVAGRSVHVLSRAEKKVFWVLRYHPNVEDIYEQFPLIPKVVEDICNENMFSRYPRTLSTDFLVRLKNGGFAAFSVKGGRSVFSDRNQKRYERMLRRQFVEKTYWEQRGVPFHILFGDEISDAYVQNIKDVMMLWPESLVHDPVTKLKHEYAHHRLVLPRTDERLDFVQLAESQ